MRGLGTYPPTFEGTRLVLQGPGNRPKAQMMLTDLITVETLGLWYKPAIFMIKKELCSRVEISARNHPEYFNGVFTSLRAGPVLHTRQLLR